ncbi:MAG: VCBS repeat-containing protein [Chryseolinea sp.]
MGVIDINNDGLMDLLFTANMSDNKLYLNKGNFHFEDITAQSVLYNSTNGPVACPLLTSNQDGWQDIAFGYAGP